MTLFRFLTRVAAATVGAGCCVLVVAEIAAEREHRRRKNHTKEVTP